VFSYYDREGNAYDLNLRNPDDLRVLEWLWSTEYRRVAFTELGDAHVSTVFMPLDHSMGYGPPLIYETMVFGGDLDGDQWRYATEDDALLGHQNAVDLVSLFLAAQA
jgi:hypothetical protein